MRSMFPPMKISQKFFKRYKWVVTILTIERAISAVNAVRDADNPYERLQGLVLKHEDFHCEMNFLQV